MIEALEHIFSDRFMSKIEFMTMLISFFGMIIALAHAHFFRNIFDPLASRIRYVFLTDAAVYLVTFVMGLGLFMNWYWVVKIDIFVRVFVLAANVYASVRLYKHYKKVGV